MYSQLIVDNQEKISSLHIFTREYQRYDDLLSLHKIISFVWPRRVGKTFLMLQFIQQLIAKKVLDISQVVYIDFSVYKWEKLDAQLLLDQYYKLNTGADPFFVFDEIQDIKDFQKFVLFFYNKWFRIFVSGSNSTLLSSELSTNFRGRIFQYSVYPLTFREVLLFNAISIESIFSSKSQWLLDSLLQQIMIYGSYPEIVLSKNSTLKESIVKDYTDIMIYKDLMERYHIENEVALRFFIKRVIGANSKQININAIYNDCKSQQIAVGKSTLYDYMQYCENVFLCSQIINTYSPKWFKKAFLYNLWSKAIYNNEKDMGRNFETLVYLELLQRFWNISYKYNNNKEIDFYSERLQADIQVCWLLYDDNFDREIYFSSDCKRKILIVYEVTTSKKIPQDIELITRKDFFIHWIPITQI